LISLKFDTEFDHVTPDVCSRSSIKGQGHSVKTSSDLIAKLLLFFLGNRKAMSSFRSKAAK